MPLTFDKWVNWIGTIGVNIPENLLEEYYGAYLHEFYHGEDEAAETAN
jgi:hypothetical protein